MLPDYSGVLENSNSVHSDHVNCANLCIISANLFTFCRDYEGNVHNLWGYKHPSKMDEYVCMN